MSLSDAPLFYVVGGLGCAALALHSAWPLIICGVLIYCFGEMFSTRQQGRRKKGRK